MHGRASRRITAAATGCAALLLSACGAAPPGRAPGQPAVPPSGAGRPAPALPQVRVRADGRLLSGTALNQVRRGRQLVLQLTVSPPSGTLLTALALGISPAVPTWAGPGTRRPPDESELLGYRHLHLSGPERFTVTWTPGHPGRAFLAVWLVTGSRQPPDPHQGSRTVIRLTVVRR